MHIHELLVQVPLIHDMLVHEMLRHARWIHELLIHETLIHKWLWGASTKLMRTCVTNVLMRMLVS